MDTIKSEIERFMRPIERLVDEIGNEVKIETLDIQPFLTTIHRNTDLSIDLTSKYDEDTKEKPNS